MSSACSAIPILWADEKATTYGLEYDYCSIMHYGDDNQFVENRPDCRAWPMGKVACNIKGRTVTWLGQRIGLSEKDKVTIRRRYGCKGLY